MKRILLTAVMAVGLVGTASAQNLADPLGALRTTVANLNVTTLSLVSGDAGATAVNLNNTVNGLTIGLSSGTPLEGLAVSGYELSSQLLAMGLTKTVTDLLTEQSQPVVVLLAPFSAQAVSLVGVLSNLPGLGGGVPGVAPTAGSSETLGLGALTALLGNVLGDNNFLIPGLGALPLNALPLDTLDPSLILGLLGGASLPGMGDAGLPGADSLPIPDSGALPLDALSPSLESLDLGALIASLGNVLGNGNSTAPGLDALPLEALNPSFLLGGLLGGASLPGMGDAGLPGAGSLTGLLDPAALTGLLGGGLPGADSLPIPGLDALPINLLDPTILTGLLNPAILTGLLSGAVPSV